MQNTIILTLSTLTFIGVIATFIIMMKLSNKISDITNTLTYQYNMIMKIQSTLKNKNATNAVAENAEIIYSDLFY